MTKQNYSVQETHVRTVFTINVWDNGIMHVEVPGNTVVQIKHIKGQYEFFKERYDQKNKFLILVESGHDSTLTKEAREFSSLPETNAMTEATAVVVKSLAERIIINFIINVTNRQAMKIRLFDNKDKAINWLLSLKQNADLQKNNSNLTACL